MSYKPVPVNTGKPITEKNEFFDPAAFDSEVLGFYEEYVSEDPSSGYGYKLLGIRPFTTLPTRALGVAGVKEVTFTENIELHKGHKLVTLKASKKRPVKAFAMIQIIGGKSNQ